MMDENTRAREAGQRMEIAAAMAPTDEEREAGEIPQGSVGFQGFRAWLLDRATAHRADKSMHQRRSETRQGLQEALLLERVLESTHRAEECEAILKAIGRYWLGRDEPRLQAEVDKCRTVIRGLEKELQDGETQEELGERLATKGTPA